MWWEVPNHLESRKGKLFIANSAAVDIAKKHGTPTYVYNTKRIAELYNKFYKTMKKHIDKDIRVHYALKANSNLKILEVLNKEGAWIDAVSPEEAKRALDAGIPKERILFTGVSVSNEDLSSLVAMGVQINIDSVSELQRLGKIKPKSSISIRMDPGVSGLGHHWTNITAGKEAHGVPIKFGIAEDQLLKLGEIAKKESFNVEGLHEHVGSNWRTKEEIEEFLKTVDIVIEKAKKLQKIIGHNLKFIDFGGGPGVRYMESHPEFPLDLYAEEIGKRIDKSNLDVQAICFEPGRYLVADSGLLLVKVVDVKERYGDKIVGVNSGFNHLMRPVMYGSYHEIINCSKADSASDSMVTIAGNVCETGDVFTTQPRKMPMPEEGDILAIHNAGAYGYVMASKYNLRELPKEIVL